jgi:hypothetical protein
LSRGNYAEKQGPGLSSLGFGSIFIAGRSDPGKAAWIKQKLLFAFP